MRKFCNFTARKFHKMGKCADKVVEIRKKEVMTYWIMQTVSALQSVVSLV